MKKTAVVVCILSGMSMTYAMDESLAKAKQGRTIPRQCCLLTAAVPACYECVQRRNNTPENKQRTQYSQGLSDHKEVRFLP